MIALAKLLKYGIGFSSMTLISRMAGMIRDILIANQFGASLITDAFLIAFKIPNFFRRIVAEGTFNSVYIPVLSRVHKNESARHLRRFIASSYGVFGLIQLLLAALIGFGAPYVIAVFAPGILDNPEQYQLTIELLRWTAPFLFFVSFGAMLAALLNYHNRFLIASATPIILNLSLIGAIAFGEDWHHTHIVVVAAATSVAGLLQILVLLPLIHKMGYFILPSLRKIHRGVTEIMRLMIPVIFGAGLVQFSLLIDTLIASLLTTGSITWLYYSNRLIEFPLGVFAIALATVITPTLSRIANNHNPKDDVRGNYQYRITLNWALQICWIIALPSTIGLVLLSESIVRVLFEHGQFSGADTRMTVLSLYAYAVGLPAFMLIKPLVTSYYAHKDTRTPLKFVAWGALVSICGYAVVLTLHYGFRIPALHIGLALSTSFGAWVNALLLLIECRRRRWLGWESHPPGAEPVDTPEKLQVDTDDNSTTLARKTMPKNQLPYSSLARLNGAIGMGLIAMTGILSLLIAFSPAIKSVSIMAQIALLLVYALVGAVTYFGIIWSIHRTWRRA